jgi:4-amino-4-deoxy-L-arabinose transferase-like glycosyltransferase
VAPQVARGTSDAYRLAAFATVVFLLKLIVMAQLRDHPLLQPDAGLDTSSYIQLSQRVLAGDVGLGPGLYYLSPLYIYFLAALTAVGGSLTFVRVVQVALGAASVSCLFVTTREWFGRRAAWAAAVLAALTGLFTFHEILLLQAALDPFLTSAALMCLALALTRSGPGARAFERCMPSLAGLTFGAQTLNRPNVAVAAAGIVVALAMLRRWRAAAFVLAGFLVALAPVVARNAVVAHQWAVLSSHGGLNFYIGNNGAATGQYVAVPGVRANIDGQADDTRRIAEQAVGHPLSDNDVSRYFAGLAWLWVRANPGSALKLFGRKLYLVFSAHHQWLDFSYPYYAHDLNTALRALIVGPWLLVPLGLTGLVICGPVTRRREYLAWALFVPLYAVAVAVFFVAERYRLPLFVPLCAGAGATLDRFARAAAERRWRPVTAAAAIAGVIAVAVNWPSSLNDGRVDERLRLAKVLMNHRDYDAAATELQKVGEIDAANTTAEFTLGIALVSGGHTGEGIARARHAVDRGVPITGARYTLVRAMQVSGDEVGAAQLLRSFQPAPEDDAESCVQVARLAEGLGATDVAERFLRRAMALRPQWDVPQQQLRALLANGPRLPTSTSRPPVE